MMMRTQERRHEGKQHFTEWILETLFKESCKLTHCEKMLAKLSHYPSGRYIWGTRLKQAELEMNFFLYLTYESGWADSPLKQWANEKTKNA